ncbi:MAG: efflux RND transporter periplasmic adaptor subunit [Oscillospiraceae bacterium]|nr:efflux RND transporter periplasmic adaptor subunit [Oscillospiraceae bacterium]
MKKLSLFARMTALAVAAAALPLLCMTGCGGTEIVEEANFIPVQALEQQDLMDFISVSGTVEGSNTVHVATELTAKVASLNVELGSQVKEGDILCTFDSTDLQKEYDALKKQADRSNTLQQRTNDKHKRALQDAKTTKAEMLQKAQREIDTITNNRAAAQAQMDNLQRQLNEMGKQIESFSADDPEMQQELIATYNQMGEQIAEINKSIVEFDAALAEAKEAYKDAERSGQDAIDAAQEAIDDALYEQEDETAEQLEEIQKQIDSCVVKADRSGVVTALNIAEGSIPSSPTLMTIEDTNTLRINVTIAETDILDVHEGQLATIATNATGDTEFTGKVSRVVNISSSNSDSPYGEPSTGYSAEITIDGTGNQLLIGMSARVKIVLDEKKDVFAVPYDAIGENEDGDSVVYVADESGDAHTVRCVKVETGMEADFLTEISSSELKEGDLIITDIFAVAEGDSIQIMEGYNDAMDEENAMNAIS